ncbi:hypothetical protein FVR03_17165 [Pontibacter qinzhouensis]|uniref:Uncharacterized protein n=1 Tax=Pontibacter qinzhouensis TaxID=2603253 RepID=A0A5C8JIY9_9BACT|nr:hypothetical protein [Pontibacter qinzhouensis]TXK36664.1 hypothetical protein FVR03_17165 [Pontibacter qinzhouensis]
MSNYKANSTNSTDFNLETKGISVGKLKYGKWYSFKAEVVLADNSHYQLEPKGVWDSVIELQKDGKTLLEFEMGWKGIVIKTLFKGVEKKYLLKLTGILSSKFVLIDTDEKMLLAVDADFKWTSFNFDFQIETTSEFEEFENKELLLLTTLHCINYYITFISSVS